MVPSFLGKEVAADVVIGPVLLLAESAAMGQQQEDGDGESLWLCPCGVAAVPCSDGWVWVCRCRGDSVQRGDRAAVRGHGCSPGCHWGGCGYCTQELHPNLSCGMSAGRAVNKAWKRETVSCCPFAPLWLWSSRVPSSTTWVRGWGLHCNGDRALPAVGRPSRASSSSQCPVLPWWLSIRTTGFRPRGWVALEVSPASSHHVLGDNGCTEDPSPCPVWALGVANQPGGRRDLLYRMGSRLGQVPNPCAPRLLRASEFKSSAPTRAPSAPRSFVPPSTRAAALAVHTLCIYISSHCHRDRMRALERSCWSREWLRAECQSCGWEKLNEPSIHRLQLKIKTGKHREAQARNKDRGTKYSPGS